jgi:hypothetical protein
LIVGIGAVGFNKYLRAGIGVAGHSELWPSTRYPFVVSVSLQIDAPHDGAQQIAEARNRLGSDEPVRVVERAYGVSDKTLRAG